MVFISVPPEEPTISITDDINLKGLIGPYNEGDTLKLICTTIGGKIITFPFPVVFFVTITNVIMIKMKLRPSLQLN